SMGIRLGPNQRAGAAPNFNSITPMRIAPTRTVSPTMRFFRNGDISSGYDPSKRGDWPRKTLYSRYAAVASYKWRYTIWETRCSGAISGHARLFSFAVCLAASGGDVEGIARSSQFSRVGR